MSWLSKATGVHLKIGGTVGKIANTVGNGLEKYGLPIAATALLGPVGGAAVTGAERYMTGHGLQNSLLDAATTYGGGSLVKGLGKIPGVSNIEGAVQNIPGVSNLESAYGDVKGALGKIPGMDQLGGALKGAVGSALSSPQNMLNTAAGLGAAYDYKRSQDLQNQALKYATDDYSARSGLRAQGIAGMGQPEQPVSLPSSLIAGNPYSQQPKRIPGRAS